MGIVSFACSARRSVAVVLAEKPPGVDPVEVVPGVPVARSREQARRRRRVRLGCDLLPAGDLRRSELAEDGKLGEEL